MPDLQSKDECSYYICGKCKGNIRYLKTDGKPDVCPECGYGHGTRDVHDIPSEVRLDLNNLSEAGSAERGITEQTTITSR